MKSKICPSCHKRCYYVTSVYGNKVCVLCAELEQEIYDKQSRLV
ncbi:MAG: hypothetical protein Q7S92_05845 [Candidatus Diapherotrites archaeon]|nr:hypothetical protein [Candidatus Diapherotrites archaeon]